MKEHFIWELNIALPRKHWDEVPWDIAGIPPKIVPVLFEILPDFKKIGHFLVQITSFKFSLITSA